MLLNNFNSSLLPPGYLLLEDRQEENRALYSIGKGGLQRVFTSGVLDQMTPDRKMLVDETGIYIPTRQGLYVARDGAVSRISEKKDVLALTRHDALLLALSPDGIYRVQADSLACVLEHPFEAPDYGLSLTWNKHGCLFIADSHTIWIYDPSSPVPMRRIADGFNLIKSLFIDSWDRLWAATYQGAYCFFHCHFTNHRTADKNDIVKAIAACGDKVVMGTLNGKVITGGKTLASASDNFFLPGAAVIGDRVYMAGNGDIAFIQNNNLHWIGLPYDSYEFVSRRGQELIIGTRNRILAYDPKTERIDTLTEGIAHPWCAADDGRGRLWVSGNPGLYLLQSGGKNGTEVTLMVDTPTTQIITALSSDGNGNVCFARGDRVYAIVDGVIRPLPETDATLSGHEIRSIHLSPRGFLIVAATDGLLVARIRAPFRADDIHWYDNRSGFTLIEPLQGPMAETDDGTVWLAGPEEVTSFPVEQLMTHNPETAIVKAPRPWWQRGWAGLLGALVLLPGLWWVVRKIERMKSRKRMERLSREKKQKELQLEAVRLKSIPHFHANVLSSIEYFIMNHSADEASHYLKLYADFTNQTLSDIDKPFRTLAQEIDYVRIYLELEKLRFGDRLQYTITAAPDVDKNTPLPTMLLHTYCQNAVKHGIAAKTGPGRVDVLISREKRDDTDGVLVVVSDNGVGRKAAALTGEGREKMGLKILSQQIELYNRENSHPMIQHVTDRTDGEGHPEGTSFEMWIPSDYQY